MAQRSRPRQLRFCRDDAVTPVIGSILILAITILGIAGILLWGAPTLQSIQDQNAQAGMVGEFQEMRRDSLVLSITDSSRVPRVNLETGTFGLQEGTRIMVSSMHDPGFGDCGFHVTGWQAAPVRQFSVDMTDCRTFDTSGCPVAAGEVCLRVFDVSGGNTFEKDITYDTSSTAPIHTFTLDDADADLTEGDWRFMISDGSANTDADAWLLSTQALHWQLDSQRELAVRLEGGAIFSQQGETVFLQENPPISEEAFGNAGDFVLRLPTYTTNSQTTLSGRGSPSVFLSLVGQNLRISTDEAYMVRFDFHGTFAEGWCNGLLFRNAQLAEGEYQDEDGATNICTTPDDDVWSLRYTRDAGAGTAPDPFAFEFIHARITTSLQA